MRCDDEFVRLFVRPADAVEPKKQAVCIVLWMFLFAFVAVFPEGTQAPVEARMFDAGVMEDVLPEFKHREVETVEPGIIRKPWLSDPVADEPTPVDEAPPDPHAPSWTSAPRIPSAGPRKPPPSPSRPVWAGTTNLVNPKVIEDSRETPEYTECAKRMRLQGEVILRALIDREGNVTRVELRRGLGRCRLDENAIAALKRWKYTPGLLEGRPVDVILTVRVKFRLD